MSFGKKFRTLTQEFGFERDDVLAMCAGEQWTSQRRHLRTEIENLHSDLTAMAEWGESTRNKWQ